MLILSCGSDGGYKPLVVVVMVMEMVMEQEIDGGGVDGINGGGRGRYASLL